jgi:hypothetical protein
MNSFLNKFSALIFISNLYKNKLYEMKIFNKFMSEIRHAFKKVTNYELDKKLLLFRINMHLCIHANIESRMLSIGIA